MSEVRLHGVDDPTLSRIWGKIKSKKLYNTLYTIRLDVLCSQRIIREVIAGKMSFGHKGHKGDDSKFSQLLWGAILILFVVPVALYVLKAMNNGAGIELPYVVWIFFYAIYVFAVIEK